MLQKNGDFKFHQAPALQMGKVIFFSFPASHLYWITLQIDNPKWNQSPSISFINQIRSSRPAGALHHPLNHKSN